MNPITENMPMPSAKPITAHCTNRRLRKRDSG